MRTWPIPSVWRSKWGCLSTRARAPPEDAREETTATGARTHDRRADRRANGASPAGAQVGDRRLSAGRSGVVAVGRVHRRDPAAQLVGPVAVGADHRDRFDPAGDD